MQYFSGENRTGHSCCLPITIGIRSFPQTIKSQCAAGNKDVLKTDQRHLDIRNYHTSPCHIVKSSLIGMLLVTRNTAKHARKPTNKIPRLHVNHVHTCCWQNSPLFSKKQTGVRATLTQITCDSYTFPVTLAGHERLSK